MKDTNRPQEIERVDSGDPSTTFEGVPKTTLSRPDLGLLNVNIKEDVVYDHRSRPYPTPRSSGLNVVND